MLHIWIGKENGLNPVIISECLLFSPFLLLRELAVQLTPTGISPCLFSLICPVLGQLNNLECIQNSECIKSPEGP